MSEQDIINLLQQLIDLTRENVSTTKDALALSQQSYDLQKLSQNRWERQNAKEADDPVYDWAEVTLAPGFSVIFTLNVPEGCSLYLKNISANFDTATAYQIIIDGQEQPETDEVVSDFGDHWPYFSPPKIVYAQAQIIITNNSVSTKNYVSMFEGWFRLLEE